MTDNTQKNMAVLRKWFNALNENDAMKGMAAAEEMIGEGYMLHDPSVPGFKPGRESGLEFCRQLFTNYTNMHLETEDMFAVDDKVVTRAVFEFTDTATKEHQKVAGIVISLFDAGKVIEEWQVLAPIVEETK